MARARGWTSLAILGCLTVLAAAPAAAAEDEDATIILFSGRDLWRNGAFMYGGFLLAPGGFERDGILLKVLVVGGAYRYRAGDLGDTSVIGVETAGQVMPGWRVKRHNTELKFFFGPDIERHFLWPDDPGNRLRGTNIGLRAALETWTEPTPNTMLTTEVSMSTIATNWSWRVAGGWRVLEDMFTDGFYIGPEVQRFGSDGYGHTRFGAHFTGLKADNYEWSAAAGWAHDTQRTSAPYVRLNVSTRL
jgi:hypothetical protein